MQKGEAWGLFEEDRWGFSSLYDGPFDTMAAAEDELDRLLERNGFDSWAADLVILLYHEADYEEGMDYAN